MIGGFVDPTAGDVLLHGHDVTDLPPNRRDVNTVFQSYALFDHLSIWDNVAFGLRRHRVGRAEMKRRVGEMLELVQLTGRDKDMPRSLSGGQRQRVALARALVNRPSVLLLDEPLAALDLKLRKAMQVELKRIQREVGITFVFVTHDQDEALTMSDRIAVMSEGRIHQVGTPEDIYERPATAFVAGFIGTANRMAGEYRDGAITLAGDMVLPTGPLADCDAGRPRDDRRTSREDLALRPHPGDGADRRHRQGHRVRRPHHDVPARDRGRRGARRARAEPRSAPAPRTAGSTASGSGSAGSPSTASSSAESHPFASRRTSMSHDVVVIGAGLAGLAAARDLDRRPAPTCSCSRPAPVSEAGSSRSPSRTGASSSSAVR